MILGDGITDKLILHTFYINVNLWNIMHLLPVCVQQFIIYS